MRRGTKAYSTIHAQETTSPNSPWDRVLTGLLLLWAFLLGCTPMRDTDIWWHLRTGQLIWQKGTVPLTDWYLYTDYDKPWIDLHWGFQLLMAGLYALGGVDLMVLTKAACLTLTVAIGWLVSERALSPATKAAAWLLPVVCLSGRAFVRPEMLTLVFLALWIWIITRLEERPRWIWWLPAVQLVWTNCHALFILGLVVGGAYVADRIVRQIAAGRWGLAPAAAGPSFRTLFRAGLLTVLVSFVNPYFEEGVLFPLVLYRKFSVEQEFYGSRIGEFQQPWAFVQQHGSRAFLNPYFDAELLLWLATAGSFVWLIVRHRRWNVLRLLLFAAFSHLAWEASRNTNVFALVAGTVLCQNLGELARLRGAALPSRRFARSMAAVLAALLLLIPTGLWAELSREDKRFALGEARAWYPHAAMQFAGREGMPANAFVCHFGHASLYSFYNGPERRVFMDGRLEVATQETFALFERINEKMATRDESWQEDLLRFGPLPTLIFDSRYSRSQINGVGLTPGWALVFADESAAVFVPVPIARYLRLPPADPAPLLHPPGL